MTLSRRGLVAGAGLAMGLSNVSAAAAKSTDFKDLQAAVRNAIQAGGVLRLPAGTFKTPGLRIDGPLRLEGVSGQTKILCPEGGPILVIDGAGDVTLAGLTFSGDLNPVPPDNKGSALVMAAHTPNLVIEDCTFTHSTLVALRLESSGGRITNSTFRDTYEAIFALDSTGLSITGNTVEDIGNNGIQVWTSAKAADGTLVRGNRITGVRAGDGGTGENGNGVAVFRAGDVIVSENRIHDCTFSAIRNNSGDNCQIINNTVSKLGETALYCEFSFEGAVVSGNIVDGCGLGVSITNFNDGGRLAVCAGNVIRRSRSGGIHVEADTVVTGNIIDITDGYGISLGWGEPSRNLSATNNVVRDCWRGITFTAVEGTGPVLITGNRISGNKAEAIAGMEWTNVVSGDYGAPGAEAPPVGFIVNNLVS
jgi:uncharacterized secreted repeat protein (TIGR03808 family)